MKDEEMKIKHDDELEKEAEKYVPNINWHAYSSKEIREAMMLYYRKGAEPREKRIEELANQLERAKVYLKATSDLLQKQNESHYVLNLLNTTVFYDEADCDGYCLKDEIDTFLETGV